MRVAQQAHADRQAGRIVEIFLNETERAQIVGDFLDVVDIADGETRLFIE